MGDVQVTASQFRQDNVTRHHDILCGIWDASQAKEGRDPTFVHTAAAEATVLFVSNDRHTQGGAILKGATHQVRIHHGQSVVRHSHRAMRQHVTDFGELLSRHSVG